MKSALLFAFMHVLANFMWCGRTEEPPPIPPAGGTYHTVSLESWHYDANGQVIGEAKFKYNRGERTFELNNESGSYKEFENGVLTKSGSYIDKGQTISIITGSDTLVNDVIGIGESSLWLNRVESTANGKSQITIKAEK